MDEANRLTKTGEVMGTPAYMPPEQASGEKDLVDERADVYGLGATFYHLLTGEAPFKGATVLNILSKVMREAPSPPRQLAPDVPGNLEAICLRCLEKEPDQRYPSMAELAADLERALAGKPTRAGRRGSALAAAALVLGGLGVAAAASAGRTRDPAVGVSPTASSSPSASWSPVAAAPSSPEESPSEPSITPLPPLEERVLEGAGWLQPEELEIRHAWAVRLEPTGLRLTASGGARNREVWPEVLLPVFVGQGPFAIELDARVHALEPSGQGNTLDLALERVVGEDTVAEVRLQTRALETGPSFPLALPSKGGSFHLLRWDARVDLSEGGELAGGAEKLSSWWRRGHGLRLQVEYDASGQQLRFETALEGSKAQRWVLKLADPLPSGDYRLRIGLNLDVRRSPVRFGDVSLERLTLKGLRSAVATSGPTGQVGRASREILAGDVERAGEQVLQWKINGLPGDEDFHLLGEASYVEALAWARAGDVTRAEGLLLGLAQQSLESGAGWFRGRWPVDVCAYSQPELVALAAALGKVSSQASPAKLQEQAAAIVNHRKKKPHEKLWGRALLLFLQAGEEASAEAYPLELGRAWLMTGHFERALEILGPLEEGQPGASRGRAGYAAHRLHDIDRAIALWRLDPKLDEQFKGYYVKLLLGDEFLAKARDSGRR
jgi:hypothetical protein